jgi:preprotein translocase subunit YajC
MLIASIFTLVAASTPSKSSTTSTGSTTGSLIFFVVVIGLLFLMYRMFMRPRQRAAQAQRDTILTLEPGDEVLTGAGIFGTVQHVQGDRVTLWTGTGSTITILRRTIVRKVEEDDPEYGTAEDHDDDHQEDHDSWDDEDTAALQAHKETDEDPAADDEDAPDEAHEAPSANGSGQASQPAPEDLAGAHGNDTAGTATDGHLADKIEELTSPDRSSEDEDR